MAGFPYGAAHGLGGMQIFLGLAAMGLGVGDVVVGAEAIRYERTHCFHLFYLGSGIWTGTFFLIAGWLAAVIREGRTVGCQSSVWHQWRQPYGGGYDVMLYLEIALAVVGFLEFVFSMATASVCCYGGPYYQSAANQVTPMVMMPYPTIIQQPAVPAPVQPYHFPERPETSYDLGRPSVPVLPPITTGAGGQMATLPAAEFGVQYAEARNGTVVE
uniref:Uncharacterized protein n=1 Tax=Branchiostoma floridae TaxID=7739 RepID=C3YU58_BRAFL|eukprot:XP_002600323.1 hypothetical protein BRAFLDRAFT_66825 [Branchiostoma floridae]